MSFDTHNLVDLPSTLNDKSKEHSLLESHPKLSLGFSFYVFIQNQPSVSLRVITLLYTVYRSTQSHKLYSFSVVLHQGAPSFVHREQKVNIKLWCSHLNN